MAKNEVAKKREQKSKNEMIKIIGYELYWTIREIECPAADMLDRVDKNFGEKFRPDSPAMQRNVRLALEAADKSGVITRIPSDDSSKVAYTLHKKEIDRVNIDLDLEKEQTIVYDKSSDTVEVKVDFCKAEIMDLIARYSNVYTADDIRRVLKRYIDAKGVITLRETGGIYFTPDENVKNALSGFIESMGGTAYTPIVYDVNGVNVEIYRELVKDEIDSELQKATEELKQVLAANDGKGRINSLESRMEKFQEIKAKAEIYRDLLSMDVNDLSSQVDAVSKEIDSALSGKLEEYPQAKAFPLHSRVQYTGKAKEKHGDSGEVIGYSIGKESCGSIKYCKVLFDKTDKVVPVTSASLKLV